MLSWSRLSCFCTSASHKYKDRTINWWTSMETTVDSTCTALQCKCVTFSTVTEISFKWSFTCEQGLILNRVFKGGNTFMFTTKQKPTLPQPCLHLKKLQRQIYSIIFTSESFYIPRPERDETETTDDNQMSEPNGSHSPSENTERDSLSNGVTLLQHMHNS